MSNIIFDKIHSNEMDKVSQKQLLKLLESFRSLIIKQFQKRKIDDFKERIKYAITSSADIIFNDNRFFTLYETTGHFNGDIFEPHLFFEVSTDLHGELKRLRFFFTVDKDSKTINDLLCEVHVYDNEPLKGLCDINF